MLGNSRSLSVSPLHRFLKSSWKLDRKSNLLFLSHELRFSLELRCFSLRFVGNYFPFPSPQTQFSSCVVCETSTSFHLQTSFASHNCAVSSFGAVAKGRWRRNRERCCEPNTLCVLDEDNPWLCPWKCQAFSSRFPQIWPSCWRFDCKHSCEKWKSLEQTWLGSVSRRCHLSYRCSQVFFRKNLRTPRQI